MSSTVGHYAWYPKLPPGNSVLYAPGPMGVTVTECDCHSVRLIWDTVFSPASPGPGLWLVKRTHCGFSQLLHTHPETQRSREKMYTSENKG